MQISPSALAVLRRATIEGDKVRLASSDAGLPRPLYLEVNDVLTRLGGKWRGGKTAAHVFAWYDPAVMLPPWLDSGEAPPDNPTEFFPTPAVVVEEMMDWARVGLECAARPDGRMLEPSAGIGGIAAIVRDAYPTVQIDCVEILAPNRELLARRGFNVVGDNILNYFTERRYDLVLMNPPFAAYQEHVSHAYDLLKPGGTLVSVAPAGIKWNSSKAGFAFYSWVLENGGLMDLPEHSFKASGTDVSTCLIKVEKQDQGWRRREYNGHRNWYCWNAQLIAESGSWEVVGPFQRAQEQLWTDLDAGRDLVDMFGFPLPACVALVKQMYQPVIEWARTYGDWLNLGSDDYKYLAQQLVQEWRSDRRI